MNEKKEWRKSTGRDTKIENDLREMPHAVGPEKSVLSSILKTPDVFMKLCRAEKLIAEDFYVPSHVLLFEFLQTLQKECIDIELVSLVQHLLDNGLLDKIGGPSYLTELYTHAASDVHFMTHLQLVRDKSLARELIKNANKLIEETYDAPGDVRSVITIQEELIRNIKFKSENRATEFKRYRENVVESEELKEGVKNYMRGDRLLGGDPFFLPDFELGFRKHEITLWTGFSFHGKSQGVQNQVANLIARKQKSLIASFEQPPDVTLGQIINALAANPKLAFSDEYDAAFAYVKKYVFMYKGQRKASPKQLVGIFRQAYLNDGVDNFVLDNVMTMDIDRGDNTQQAAAADEMRMFANDYPVHLHLVAHPRKVMGSEKTDTPPMQNDIRGAAEWGDVPNNVLVVWRDTAKGDRMAEMKDGNFTEEAIHKFWESTPCGKFVTRKQRATGLTPMCSFWFDRETNRFMHRPANVYPMFDEKPW